MNIEWNNQESVFWHCVVEDKIKIYPKHRTLMLGKIKNRDAYSLLKDAWFADTMLRRYRFPVCMRNKCDFYILEGWKILKEKEK
jgi:hypothetical protein